MFSRNTIGEVEEVDETTYGQCRCCMANGQHRDVTKEYYYNNIKEVYKNIFLECFNLSLSPHNHISTLICENCVHRLRDATSFRMMVVATEEQLLNAVIIKSDPDNDTEFVDVTGPQNFTTEVKIETESDNVDMEPDILLDSFEGSKNNERLNNDDHVNDGERTMNADNERTSYERMIEERMNDDDDWSIKSSDNELVIDETRKNGSTGSKDFDTDDDVDGVGVDDCESTYSSITMRPTSAVDDEPCEIIEGETKLLARFPTSAPQALPTRSELTKICPVYDEHLKKLEDKIVEPKSIECYFKIPDLKERLMSEKQVLAFNATTLFEYSNATAFKTKMRNGYPCFYCREVCSIDNLREHQRKHHKASIYKLLTRYGADEFVVYADVTDLECTICKMKVKNLDELRTHLTKEHGRKIFVCPDRVIPFKLKENDFECQKCGRNFETFGAVEKHMNSHFGCFMCDACGAGFITKHRLAVHNYTQHKDEKVVCEVCKKSFRTQVKYRLHFEGVHKNIKKFKCTKCPEKFIDYFTRQKHLVDVHYEAPLLYKCNVCPKGFNRRYSLLSHVKRCHIDEKNVKCQECAYACHTKSELKDHMIKHQSPQKFKCPTCMKTYGRKRSLAMHIKKHKNDKA